MQCPFVYANGRRCCGGVYQARAYGPHRGSEYIAPEDVRKFRLWCSDKDDHAGAVSDTVSKQRMEFYPDELRKLGIYKDVVAMCGDVASETESARVPEAVNHYGHHDGEANVHPC